jgi:DNA-binding FrmR family transcriptional regulator|tara:strand:- start:8 stop:154 length:147 start_codon:yes stop_codon:yes gene_type:complete
MNKQQIINKLANANLDNVTRELLNQQLHHIVVQAKSKGPAAKRQPKHK